MYWVICLVLSRLRKSFYRWRMNAARKRLPPEAQRLSRKLEFARETLEGLKRDSNANASEKDSAQRKVNELEERFRRAANIPQ